MNNFQVNDAHHPKPREKKKLTPEEAEQYRISDKDWEKWKSRQKASDDFHKNLKDETQKSEKPPQFTPKEDLEHGQKLFDKLSKLQSPKKSSAETPASWMPGEFARSDDPKKKKSTGDLGDDQSSNPTTPRKAQDDFDIRYDSSDKSPRTDLDPALRDHMEEVTKAQEQAERDREFRTFKAQLYKDLAAQLLRSKKTPDTSGRVPLSELPNYSNNSDNKKRKATGDLEDDDQSSKSARRRRVGDGSENMYGLPYAQNFDPQAVQMFEDLSSADNGSRSKDKLGLNGQLDSDERENVERVLLKSALFFKDKKTARGNEELLELLREVHKYWKNDLNNKNVSNASMERFRIATKELEERLQEKQEEKSDDRKKKRKREEDEKFNLIAGRQQRNSSDANGVVKEGQRPEKKQKKT